MPPYGDGTAPVDDESVLVMLSPPYGDKSKSALQGLDRQQMTFPSPCGEKLKFGTRTLMAWQRSFRPLTGMVLYDYQIKGFFKEFSPPYGDGTMRINGISVDVEFSPPYGDGTYMGCVMRYWFAFSPPYGDGTSTLLSLRMRKKFSPPYGDGTFQKSLARATEGFSPPYGDGTLNISQNIVKWKS